MKKSILTGSLAAAIVFGLTGCGGSGGSGGPGEEKPAATAELTKEDTSKIFSTYSGDNLAEPVNFLYYFDNHPSLSESGMLGASLGSNKKTFECDNGGSSTFETISGVDPNDESKQSVKHSVWKYKFEYKNCDINGNGITKTAKGEKTKDWTRSGLKGSDNYSYSSKYSGSNTGDVLFKSKKAELKLSLNKWNGLFKYKRDNTVEKYSNNYHNEYSGKLTTNDKKRTIEFKSIKIDSYEAKTFQPNESDKSSFSASGAIKDSKYKGWIVIKTEKELKHAKGCLEQGKVTIKGKQHTITVELADKEIVYKFDDEVQKRKPACK